MEISADHLTKNFYAWYSREPQHLATQKWTVPLKCTEKLIKCLPKLCASEQWTYEKMFTTTDVFVYLSRTYKSKYNEMLHHTSENSPWQKMSEAASAGREV